MPWYQNCASIPQRWIVIFTCFLGLINAYTMRLCMSIAITQMAMHKNRTILLQSSDDTCPDDTQITNIYRNESLINIKGGTFDWNEKTQGLILSSFYWGYLITSFLSGPIMGKIGGKHTLGLSVLSTSLLTILVPKTVELSDSTGLIILRFLTGIGEGAMHPAVLRLMAQWIPEDERSWAGAWAFSGMSVGTIIGMAGSGMIIHRSETGWPMVFYFYGVLGILSFFIHCGLCYDSPSVHPFISEVEENYLKDKLKHSHADLPATPWAHIIRSIPIWALFLGLIGKAWCLFTLISDMPKFMSSVMKFSVEANGFVSSIPYICSWIFSCAASYLADYTISKRIASTANVRKIFNTISMVGTSLFLVTAAYVGCDRKLVVGLHIVAMMMFGCANFGTMVNALDLAPNYAGAIQGVLFGLATAAGFLSPYVVGLLAPNQTIEEWRLVFWLIFVVCTVTNTIFVVFGRAEVQAWNDPKFLKRENIDTNGYVKENIELLAMK